MRGICFAMLPVSESRFVTSAKPDRSHQSASIVWRWVDVPDKNLALALRPTLCVPPVSAWPRYRFPGPDDEKEG